MRFSLRLGLAALLVLCAVAILFELKDIDSESLVLYRSSDTPVVGDVSELYLKTVRKNFDDSPEIIFFTVSLINSLKGEQSLVGFNSRQQELLGLIDLFMQRGVDINFKSSGTGYSSSLDGATVLHDLVVLRGGRLIVKMIELGANPLITNAANQTPLDLAYKLQSVGKEDFSEVIDVLLEYQ